MILSTIFSTMFKFTISASSQWFPPMVSQNSLPILWRFSPYFPQGFPQDCPHGFPPWLPRTPDCDLGAGRAALCWQRRAEQRGAGGRARDQPRRTGIRRGLDRAWDWWWLMSQLLGICETNHQNSHICWRWNIPNSWVMWNIGTFTNPWIGVVNSKEDTWCLWWIILKITIIIYYDYWCDFRYAQSKIWLTINHQNSNNNSQNNNDNSSKMELDVIRIMQCQARTNEPWSTEKASNHHI